MFIILTVAVASVVYTYVDTPRMCKLYAIYCLSVIPQESNKHIFSKARMPGDG